MSQEFFVSAKANSVSGGVGARTVSVATGDRLIITASYDDTWRLGAGDREGNADGLGNPLGGNYGKFTKMGFSFLYGTLVGSLDDGQTFFAVGTSAIITAPHPGILRLYCWDSNSGDNTGTITVSIDVI